MIATVWTQEGCTACIKEKTLLKVEGYELDVVVVDDPDSMDRDAQVQLHLQNGMFPVIRIGGEFRVPGFVSRAMEWN